MLGQTRQVLGDVDARHVGGPRLEFAAKLRRGVGFHVPDVDMAWAAEQIDEDARLGLSEGAASARIGGPRRFGRTQAAPQQPERSAESDLQTIPPRPAFSQIEGAALNEKHGGGLSGLGFLPWCG